MQIELWLNWWLCPLETYHCFPSAAFCSHAVELERFGDGDVTIQARSCFGTLTVRSYATLDKL